MKNDMTIVEQTASQRTPSALISAAIEKGSSLEQVRELLNIQKEWEANEAKKAFNKAVAAFKANPPRITKDKQNVQYKSMYTTLGNLVNTVNPELSKQGLSANWEIEQNGSIKVTCILTHALGHSEKTSASAPADTSGSKNAIQQIKSTITYLKAVTFESITGLASTDANYDDDGNAHGEVIDQKQLGTLRDMMADKGVNEEKFCSYLKVDALESLPKSKYEQAFKALEAKVKK